MADNFDFRKYLVENKLGAYSKAATINEEMQEDAAPKYKTYADVVNAIAKKYSYTVYHDEIEEFMHDKDSLKAIVAGKDPIQAYEDFYSIKRESKEDPIDPHDPYGTGGMQHGIFQEKEMEDVIYGTGDDDDYDRKKDAERTGAKFIPYKEPERDPSKFTRPSSHGEVVEKLVNKMRILNRLAIDKYKYAKKEARPAAKEELHKAVEYMLGSNSRYADEVVKRLLQPIHDQWAKYAQSKKS